MSEDERPVSRAAKALSLLLALLPPARMAWIVFTNGENNLSNDYVARVPLVVSILDGTSTVGKFVREAWIGGGHSLLATQLMSRIRRLFDKEIPLQKLFQFPTRRRDPDDEPGVRAIVSECGALPA